MRLVDNTNMPVPDSHDNIHVNGNGVNGNGNGINHVHYDDDCGSDTESETEEAEPVSATLVLRVVSEPPSPALSRKSSFNRRDQPPSFLTDESRGEQYLQVQVQRSTSTGSISGSRPQSRSRPLSAAPSFCITDTSQPPSYQMERYKRYSGVSSRDSSMSPTPSMYGVADLEQSEVNSTDFMQKISDQTKMIQEGMKTLRSEMDSQMRMLDIGQEAVVLSGLNKHATNSLKNIKNLYDETKYLKSYLEKLEAKVHYDMSVQHRTPYTPPWYRRVLFVGAILGAAAWIWRRQDQSGFDRNMVTLSESAMKAYLGMVEFFTSKDAHSNVSVTLR